MIHRDTFLDEYLLKNEFFIEDYLARFVLSEIHTMMLRAITGFYPLIGHRNGKILRASIVKLQACEIMDIIALAIRQG